MITVSAILAFTIGITLFAQWMRGRHPFLIAGLIGMLMGIAIDYIFGWRLGLYYYVHHQWWAPDYYYLIYPAWAMDGIIAWELWQILRGAFKKISVRVLMLSLFFAVFSELLGAIGGCWHYDAPIWLIISGWILYQGLLIYLINFAWRVIAPFANRLYTLINNNVAKVYNRSLE